MLENFFKPINQFRKSYLPGIITGSADDDPSSISTYSIAGVTTGFSQLWLLLISTPLLIAVFSMSARIGDVTKRGLITLIGQRYGRKTSLLCMAAFVVTNFFILIADVIGMSAGMQLITGENYIYFIVPALVLIWYIVVFDNYKKILRYFSWLSGILLAYIFSGILAGPNWLLVIKSTFIPHISFNLTYFAAAIGLLGATFAPYAFFWETDEEIAEEKGVRNIKKSSRGVVYGFIYSNLIAFFIIVASASVVFNSNVNLLTVNDIAKALEPLAGSLATKLFGLGLVGSGILAIPVLAASSASAVAEFFHWPEGLNKKPKNAKGFYAAITLGFIICLITLIFRLNPIRMMFYSQFLAGAIAPLFIFFILKIASSKKIMGEYCCGRWSILGGWLAILILLLGDAFFIYQIMISL